MAKHPETKHNSDHGIKEAVKNWMHPVDASVGRVESKEVNIFDSSIHFHEHPNKK